MHRRTGLAVVQSWASGLSLLWMTTTASFGSEYVLHTTGGCDGRNELGLFTEAMPLAYCQALCTLNTACISFEHFNPNQPESAATSTNCQLSSTCTYDLSVQNSAAAYALYVAGPTVPLPVYNVYTTGGCDGLNELGIVDDIAQAECQARCSANSACISFEHRPYISSSKPEKCQLSSSCTYDKSSQQSPSDWVLGVRGPRYTRYDLEACTDANELGVFSESLSLAQCQALCSANPACVSFEYPNFGKVDTWPDDDPPSNCQLSATCTYALTGVAASYDLYVKGTTTLTPTLRPTCAKFGGPDIAVFGAMSDFTRAPLVPLVPSTPSSSSAPSTATCISICDFPHRTAHYESPHHLSQLRTHQPLRPLPLLPCFDPF